MTTNDYLDAVKTRLSIDSDYRLSKTFGCHTSAISNYRNGRSHLGEEAALKVAEILKIDPAQVLADVAAERTKCPAAKVAWERAARRLSAALVVVFSVVLASPTPAEASAGKTLQNAKDCILCQIGRILIKWLKRLFWGLGRCFADFAPKKIFQLFLISSLFLPLPALADDWTPTDTRREIAYQTLGAIDYLQTREALKDPTRHELNPILGEHPSADEVGRYFIACGLLHYGISRALPDPWREGWQWLSIGVEAAVIGHNLAVGVRVTLP